MQQSDVYAAESSPFWVMRLSRFLIQRLRPHLGWAIFLTLSTMALLPGQALGVQDWIRGRRLQTALILAGPLAVAVSWLILGWRHPIAERRWWSHLLRLLAAEAIGVLLLSQLFIRWIPGPSALIQAGRSGTFVLLVSDMGNKLGALATRFLLWWQGVQGGGAAQDDLVFAALVGLLLWNVVLFSVFILRRYRRGLAASLPLLWLISLPLIFATQGKVYLVFGLVLAVLLHVALDHSELRTRWQGKGWDYSEDLILDRAIAVVSAGLFVITLGVFTPSIAVRPVSDWYYQLLAPVDEQFDAVSERLFPELEGSRRFAGIGAGGGLPNSFLLSAGPEIGQAVVMKVRTSDAVTESPYEPAAPPEGRYMRGATYADYDGLGWSNIEMTPRQEHAANSRWIEPDWSGRRTVVQSINLTFVSSIMYGAGEPIEPSIDYRTQTRGPGDLVALYGRTESYSVVSSVPAVTDEMLANAPPIDRAEVPAEYAVHLALPDTITERTRSLAAEVTAGAETPYAKASAIEQYLRTYEYDLTVPAPPSDVVDVADFFLFDLGRGYCDYYATAFVVLARLNGLPVRFASGFAVGSWNGYQMTWTVTEAEAHSWPEVYFPEYGWIPFEPTAGRPALERIGQPAPLELTTMGETTQVFVPEAPDGIDWNRQMLFWLLPLGVLFWGGWLLMSQLLMRRRDPWQSLQEWGKRIGRPMSTGETAREYGHGLALYLTDHHRGEPGTARHVAGEIESMGRDVTAVRYGPEAARAEASERAEARWQGLHSYLRRIKIGAS